MGSFCVVLLAVFLSLFLRSSRGWAVTRPSIRIKSGLSYHLHGKSLRRISGSLSLSAQPSQPSQLSLQSPQQPSSSPELIPSSLSRYLSEDTVRDVLRSALSSAIGFFLSAHIAAAITSITSNAVALRVWRASTLFGLLFHGPCARLFYNYLRVSPVADSPWKMVLCEQVIWAPISQLAFMLYLRLCGLSPYSPSQLLFQQLPVVLALQWLVFPLVHAANMRATLSPSQETRRKWAINIAQLLVNVHLHLSVLWK